MPALPEIRLPALGNRVRTETQAPLAPPARAEENGDIPSMLPVLPKLRLAAIPTLTRKTHTNTAVAPQIEARSLEPVAMSRVALPNIQFAAIPKKKSTASSAISVPTPNGNADFKEPNSSRAALPEIHLDAVPRKKSAPPANDESAYEPKPIEDREQYFEQLRKRAHERKEAKRKEARLSKRQKREAPQSVAPRNIQTKSADLTLRVERAERPNFINNLLEREYEPEATTYAQLETPVHIEAEQAIARWLAEHKRHNPNIERALMVSGAHGCGKLQLVLRVLRQEGYEARILDALDARGAADIADSVHLCARSKVHASLPQPCLVFTECDALSQYQKASVDALKALLCPWRFGAKRHKQKSRRWIAPFIFIVRSREARVLYGLAAACNHVEVPPFPVDAMIEFAQRQRALAYSAQALREIASLAEGNMRSFTMMIEYLAQMRALADPVAHLRRIGLADPHLSLEERFVEAIERKDVESAVLFSMAGITRAPQLVQENYPSLGEDEQHNRVEALADSAHNISESDVFATVTDIDWKVNAELRELFSVYAIAKPLQHARARVGGDFKPRAPALHGKKEVLRNNTRKLGNVRNALLSQRAHCWSRDASLDYAHTLGMQILHEIESPEATMCGALTHLELSELELKFCANFCDRSAPASDAAVRNLRRKWQNFNELDLGVE